MRTPGSVIRIRQAGGRSHLRDTAMIYHEGGAAIFNIICKPLIEVCQFLCVVGCRTASSKRFSLAG